MPDETNTSQTVADTVSSPSGGADGGSAPGAATQTPAPVSTNGQTAAPAGATATEAPKRTRTIKPALPLKPLAEMTTEERAQYDALTPAKKALYDARLMVAQEAAQNKKTTGGGAKKTATQKELVPRSGLTRSFADLHVSTIEPPNSGVRPSPELAASIRERGILEAIIVAPTAGGLYRILNGERRYLVVSEVLAEIQRDGAEKVDATTEVKAGQIPAQILTGVSGDEEAGLISAITDRMRSPNALRMSRVINEERQRGRDDSFLRRTIGLKTGEVDKFAALTAVPPVVAKALKDGLTTPATALLVGRQAAHIREAIAANYTIKLAGDKNARLTEADVEEARSAASKAAITRDQPQLNALTQSVPDAEATPAAVPAQTEAPANVQTAADPTTVNP
jgi:ParB-like chromosome segregation protein Spo0J